MNALRKRALFLSAAILLCALAGCDKPAASPTAAPSTAAAHEHVFQDGKCDCGRYEVSFLTRIPIKNELTAPIEQAGSVEELTYTTHAYAVEEAVGASDIIIEKKMLVYLPYGYNAAEKYDILYLMHGGGESEYYWLAETPPKDGISAMGKTTRGVLDNLMQSGDANKTIVVAPTFYSPAEGYDDATVENTAWCTAFAQELRNDIIPLVETTYTTFSAGDVSETNLQATRDHRAFAGFSMGSYTTIQAAMMRNLDIFSYFGSYSGSLTTAAEFKAALEAGGMADYEVKYWYNGNGSADMAHDEHRQFCTEVLEQMTERFRDGKNFAWIDFQGGSHAYNCWIVDLYNCMLVFFRQ